MSEPNPINERLVKIAFFTSLAGTSFVIGFGTAFSRVKRASPDNPDAILFEEGIALARKALMRATIYSVCGFSVVAFVSYKVFGRRLIDSFKVKAKRNDEEDIRYLQNLFNAPRSKLTGTKEDPMESRGASRSS